MPSTGITLEQKVQSLLQLDEQCVKCVCGNLIKDKDRIGCLVSLIKKMNGDNALLVYQNPSQGGLGSSLTLLYALAIRGPFSVSGDTDFNRSSGLMVRFQVLTDDGVEYVFEIENSEQSMRFVTDLKAAISDYRQKAHVIGVPEFKWLERYKQQIARKSVDVPDDWPWNHVLNQILEPTTPMTSSAASTTQETKASDLFASDDTSLDIFGMPGFTPNDSIIHPSPSTSSLTKLNVTDSTPANVSPLLQRKLPNKDETREEFYKISLREREAEYINIKQFKFFIGTWNVNGRNPGSENLKPWLRCDEEPSDVVIVGFQELDLSAEALILSNVTSSSSRPKEEDWQKAVEKTLCSNLDYVKVRSIRLVGMYLLVYAKSEHMPYISSVEAQDVGTGIMGMMGNKGGVSIRMELHNTSLCFVNSHLAAHQDEYERRNQDYRDIVSKLCFNRMGNVLSIVDHDIVFWLGDLNYRISDMDVEQTKILIEEGRLDVLLKKDQLLVQKQQENCFVGFNEGLITFKPTYKYNPGSDNWDSSEKGRAPAWCDRILFRGNNIKLIKYRSHPTLRISDHKPVSSLFGVGIKVVNRDKEKQVYEDVVRTLDRHENDNLPQVKLSTTEIKFKDIQFLEKSSLILEIANTGQGPVQFSFIPKLDEQEYCKPWLNIKPHMGIIMSGDTKEVKLTVYVNKETAGALNSGDDKMEDILVLHLEGGKDVFIVVTGNYIPSVFGSSLEALVHMYGPIRDVPVANLVDLEHIQDNKPKSSLARSKEALEIPKELWLLVDHLFKYGFTEEYLLKQSGFEQEIQEIRTHLDTGKTGKIPGSIHSVAEALLIFLEALPIPVIPFSFYHRALEGCNNYLLCKQLIYQIPECHRNVFTYITAFLRELLLASTENKLDAKTLATLFGTLLLRSPKDVALTLNKNKRTLAQHTNKKTRFVYQFLLNQFDGR
ncbi:inositol polyphosphate 5-phosphatase OCRL-like isoform X2 [Actinia tenebrosa]|uniref:phosphoinositide 5-phosphatase n=1 Tax=Actinia tenebrosa TaxID=6105 RepID=A0A6P8HA93_ACTTE|nr:inositol polyphosphate 5-phosphatase OCRL-like isoform X2 [Actinia tenebrosa]